MLVYFDQGVFIGFINRQIQQNLRLLQIFRQLFEFFDFIRNGRTLLQDGLGFFRIVPESISGNQLLELGQACFFGLQVKDSSEGCAVFLEDRLSFV